MPHPQAQANGTLYPIYARALWKDADSDVPLLRQAKAEYAKLQ